MANAKNKAKEKKIVKKTAKKVAKPATKSKSPAKIVAKKDDKSKLKSKPAAQATKKDTKTDVKSLIKKATALVKSVVSKEAKQAAKNNSTSDVKKEAKAVVTKPLTSKPAKVDAKSKNKNKKVEKKEDFDDGLTLDDDFGDSEISDYEDDLKSVEEMDEEEILEISDDDEEEVKDEEVYLTDSEGRRLCRVRDCDQVSNVEGYCRYHYLLLWKKIQIRKVILIDGKLEKYVEDLTSRYPDKFLEMIRKDLKTEKDFLSVIQELEIDESAINELDNADDDQQSFSDEIRGIGDAPTSLDDDGDY